MVCFYIFYIEDKRVNMFVAIQRFLKVSKVSRGSLFGLQIL